MSKNKCILINFFLISQSIFKVPGSLPGNTITKLRTKVTQQRIEQKQDKLGR